MVTAPSAWATQRLSLPAYSFADAARYAETTGQTISRWYQGYAVEGHQMRQVFSTDVSEGLSYFQLIEVSVAATFRRAGVKLDKLRAAHTDLRKRYQVDYPFALLKLKTDGVDVLVPLLEDERVVLAASRHGQLGWSDVLLNRFEQFDYEDGAAMRWHPRGQSVPIIIDPRYSFGAPIIMGSGVRTATIKDRYLAGESLPFIEEDFDLTEQQVRAALEFENVPARAA